MEAGCGRFIPIGNPSNYLSSPDYRLSACGVICSINAIDTGIWPRSTDVVNQFTVRSDDFRYGIFGGLAVGLAPGRSGYCPWAMAGLLKCTKR